MQVTWIILNFLVTTLKAQKDTGEINFNSIFHIAQYARNVTILICNQYKKSLILEESREEKGNLREGKGGPPSPPPSPQPGGREEAKTRPMSLWL